MPSNSFELAVASLFWSSAMLGVIKSFEQPLKLQFSHLLMIFRWKTASGDVASNEILLLRQMLRTPVLGHQRSMSIFVYSREMVEKA
ncbi:hypothetical protein MTR_0081s0060 [Medicago truncatula]|uniref:Uncharacterized protein n=1 Tax=Medicago truncatula TaxID=3880 RepID=A0A072TH47_MEDTR|nr:hypothetical protein MTR_0081s0060 [Medicago truncatula]